LGGEVNVPGIYQLQAGETLTQLLAQAGGLTSKAYVYGTVFTRESVRRQQRENLDQAIRRFEAESDSMASNLAQNTIGDASKEATQISIQERRNALARLRALQPNGRIALEINPSVSKLPDLILEDGDSITIPYRSDFISVFGSVLGENSLIVIPGSPALEYLRRAGVTRFSDLQGTLILRADGSVRSIEVSDSWFASDKNVLDLPLYAGDALYVPEKVDKRTGYSQFIQGAKDISQILFNFGLTAAAFHTVGL
jgi:protein involved in polysaccharide export with SLBB domain